MRNARNFVIWLERFRVEFKEYILLAWLKQKNIKHPELDSGSSFSPLEILSQVQDDFRKVS